MSLRLFTMVAAGALVSGAVAARTADWDDCNSHDYARAITGCTAFIEAGQEQDKKKLAEAFNKRGYAQYRKGQYEAAIADQNKAIELNPDKASYYLDRGWVFMMSHQLDAALADANKALEPKPDLGSAYARRAYVYDWKGELEAALADWTKSIELRPQFVPAYARRGLREGGKAGSGHRRLPQGAGA